MKRLLLLISIIALLVPTTVLAYDTPTQGSANATDIILWYGDNLTVNGGITIDGTITVAGLETALTDFLTLFIVALLVALVFWQGTIFLYAVGSVTAIVYGLSLAIPSNSLSLWVAGVAISLIGTYFLYCIVMISFNWAKGKGKE